MSADKKYNVIFVLGGPGAGKGTQCSKIVEEYGYIHLSAGDLLRQERSNPASEVGAEIERHIKNGSIVPVEITCSLLEREMKKNSIEKKKWDFLVDGFPRNEDNNEGWKKEMTNKTTLQMVLVFNCGEDMCIERCIKRGETSGRADDNRESLKKRIVTYNNSTMPIIKYYRDRNLVRDIDAEKSTEEVFEQVKEAMKTVKS